MLKPFTNFLLALATCLLWQVPCMSQGWERSFGFTGTDELTDVRTTPDGGYITVGATKAGPVDHQIYLLKTDADGSETWSRVFGEADRQEFPKSIVEDGNGGYVIGGTSINDGISRAFLTRTDAFGNELWHVLSVQDSVQGWQVAALADGGFAIVGSLLKPSVPGAPNGEVFLMKTDGNGNILWSSNYGGALFDEGRSITQTPGGELLLAGYTNSSGAGNYDVLLLKTDATGSQIWSKTLGASAAELCFAMTPTADGHFALTGQRDAGSSTGLDVFLAKINPNGDEIWWQNYEVAGFETARSVQEAAGTGQFVLAGDARSSTNSDRQLLLMKTAPDGLLTWSAHYGGTSGDAGSSVRTAPNDGLVVAGFTNSFGAGDRDGYLIRTDATGVSLSNFVRGNVHSNLNANCVPDNFGVAVPNYLIEIAGAKTYYGTTDTAGNYFVPVEAGTYNVRLLNPSPVWEACQDSVGVVLVGVFDTVSVNFSIHPQVLCPAMEVDLSTLMLRRCFQNVYTVNYRNLGSIPAATAAVQLDLDPWLTVDSTSIPWIAHNGNMYVFDVGVVPPFAEGSFKIWVTVDCDSTLLGQTHCSEAHIFPDSLCLSPDPNWDGASIELEASCAGDSVFFKVKNIGIGDMSEPLELIVIEEVIIGFQTQFQLESFDEKTYSFLADGRTLRMEADQSPGHPGLSRPSVSVEGCGTYPFSTGYVVDYPLNDADPFMDIDCRENIGSYDPNDKQGFPTGYGEQHFIEPGTDIEYLIRFQNTGTDTAFTVVIRDTLSPLLDPTSIEPGASSHDYRFELYGSGILRFTFDHIMLPDSNVNEPLSHGFVKFRVKQRDNNPLGSLIENRAGIYFDFNAPIITNTTRHTLGVSFIEIDPVNGLRPGHPAMPSIKVYPNPFEETALFELENIQSTHLVFSLFDVNGRQVKSAIFDKNRFQFQRDGLPSGMYFFQIATPDGAVAKGKVVLR